MQRGLEIEREGKRERERGGETQQIPPDPRRAEI